MGISKVLVIALFYTTISHAAEDSLLTTLLTPTTQKTDTKLQRKSRSYYYDPRYVPRPLYERLEQERPNCGRCADRYDDRDDPYRSYDRPNRYDDDRRMSHRPTYGNRYDKEKNYDQNDNYDSRRTGERKNGTKDDGDKQEEDRRPSAGSNRRLNERERPRYDDRRRRPEYEPRDPYYDDVYRERRPLYERYPAYDAYDEGYAPRNDFGYVPARRPAYDDRYDRGNGYDDTGYGGYGPGVGRGPHDRPWDETYRGQSGWDDGGRGYYFASGRPDAGAAGWGRRDHGRPQGGSGWHDVNYPVGGGGHRDVDFAYPQEGGYRYDEALGGYKPTGWHNVNERRPYRDQSGQNDNRGYQQRPPQQNYNNNQQSDRNNNNNNRQQQNNNGQSNTATSSTTPGTSYLYEREDTQQISQNMKVEAETTTLGG